MILYPHKIFIKKYNSFYLTPDFPHAVWKIFRLLFSYNKFTLSITTIMV